MQHRLGSGKRFREEFRGRPLPKLRSERMRPPARAVASRTRRRGKAGWRQSLCAAPSPAMPPPTTSTLGPKLGVSASPPLDSIAPSRAVSACPGAGRTEEPERGLRNRGWEGRYRRPGHGANRGKWRRARGGAEAGRGADGGERRGADGGERRGADAARGRTRIGGYKPRGPPWAGPGASPGCLAHCPDGSGGPRTLGAKVSTEEHSGPPPGGSFFQRSQESGDQMAEEASPCCVTDAGQHPRLGTPQGPWVEVGGRPDESSDVRAGREELHASGATAT